MVQETDGINVHVVSLHSRFWKKLYGLLPLLQKMIRNYYLKNISHNFTPDIIHSNVLYPAGIIGAQLATELNVKHVITEHWSKAAEFLENNFFAKRGKAAYVSANGITFVSIFLRKQLEQYLRSATKVAIVPNVIDTGIFCWTTKNETETVVFTAAATWAKPKRPELFTAALAKIAKEIQTKRFELHFFGDGPQLDEIRDLTYPSNLKIHYRGYVTKHEIAKQLCRSQFFLHASDVETFSIVVAEALATGTPVIASNRGALPELLDSNNGVLCENVLEDWIAGIHTAMNTAFDGQSISENIINRFTPTAVGNAFSNFYSSVKHNIKP
jgi:glycosyltransferase involved in cell wall biosynthesis